MLSTPSCAFMASIGKIGFGKLSASLWYTRMSVVLRSAVSTSPSPADRNDGPTGKTIDIHPLPVGTTIGSEEYAIFVGGPIVGSSNAIRRNRSLVPRLLTLIMIAVTPSAM